MNIKKVVQGTLKSEDHLRVKTASAIEGCTIGRLVEKAVLDYMKRNHKNLIIADIGGGNEKVLSEVLTK